MVYRIFLFAAVLIVPGCHSSPATTVPQATDRPSSQARATDLSEYAQKGLLDVEQVQPSESGSKYRFNDIEGDDPCAVERNVPGYCHDLIDGTSNLTKRRREGESSAAIRLQCITPHIIDPTSFDAEEIADEIG